MDTPTNHQKQKIYCFNGFRLDILERRLWFANEQVLLKPKQFDLLTYFVKNAGRTATKSELLEMIWADTFVEEATLTRNISWLRTLLGKYAEGESLIETVPKMGYRFTPQVTILESEEDKIIVEIETVQHVSAENFVTIKDVADEKEINKFQTRDLSPLRHPKAEILRNSFILLFVVIAVSGFILYQNKGTLLGLSFVLNAKDSIKHSSIRQETQIKIGSIVHLQNRYPNDGSYLDAWGAVWSKPEFAQVPTETMFVSTHKSPNRDNGSGSWQIVSAIGKEKDEPLVVGDRIHLKNMYPNAGYLDACGWLEHLSVFKKYTDHVGAVFTTKSADRDDGTGVWIIRSATEKDGTPVLEGDSIAIESSYFINDGEKNRITGFLDLTGEVKELSAFNDYDGSKLVFTKNISYNEPVIDIWTITLSKEVLE